MTSIRRTLPATVLVALMAAGVHAPALAAQAGTAAPAGPTGREFAGLPALNYDADEGFGYGLLLEMYDYGPGGFEPYRYTLQPTVFLTTGGRRDFTLFFDSPHLLPAGWRIDAWLASEQQIASPFYGIGNDAPHDPALEADDPYFYRFGRTRRQLRVNLQRAIPGVAAVRGLVGLGVAHVAIDPVPFDTGTTLVEQTMADASQGWWNYVRAGLVRDTRDREVGPTRGSWTELLVQRVDDALGSEADYTRYTFTDRRYVTVVPRVVFANRVLLQQVAGDAPFYELFTVESSFKQQEGLGGAKTLRGIPKNRYVGKGMFLWNAEVRWRAADFELAGLRFHTVLSGFVDSGRVWTVESVPVADLLRDLHHGYGAGARLGMGENFVVALDVGTSRDVGAAIYIGLGYLY